jgi:uncharacterized protein YecT (DUF1311 family)
MNRAAPLIALVILAAAAASPSGAETANPRDVATILKCVKTKEASRTSAETCVEIVANPCFKGDETAASDREVIDCIDREQLAWDQLLNEAYGQLRAKLDETQQGKLRDMQRAWIADRELSCKFYYDYFEGTMANPMIASCMNRETARRALFLRIFAEGAKPQQ